MVRTQRRRGRGEGNRLMLMGLLTGAAIGAAVALFYTPGTGEQNRKRLSKWAASLAGQVQT